MDRRLRALSRAVRIIRTQLNHELPIQQLALLLEVHLNEGISMPELSKKLNMGQGSVSKNIKLMSRYIEGGELRGYDLLSTEQDIQERRRFIVSTTEKGERLLASITEAACDALGVDSDEHSSPPEVIQ